MNLLFNKRKIPGIEVAAVANSIQFVRVSGPKKWEWPDASWLQ